MLLGVLNTRELHFGEFYAIHVKFANQPDRNMRTNSFSLTRIKINFNHLQLWVVWWECKLCVMRMSWFCDVSSIYVWCVGYGSVMGVWFLCDAYVMGVWCECDLCVMRRLWQCDGSVIFVLCVCYGCLMRMWFLCIAYVMGVWCVWEEFVSIWRVWCVRDTCYRSDYVWWFVCDACYRCDDVWWCVCEECDTCVIGVWWRGWG